ncbi:MAG: cyclic nucleotide-binding domain-containing protein [Gammaproteobacteria bacterium]|nr:cyclic nucleotide-binding domain-containing protein [Gammaproteobacteria bacterium]
MAIHIKLAKTAKQIDDALRLRHEVFVIEDGKFGGAPLPEERVLDRFDAFPYVYNIVAYDDNEPIATMRLIRDSGEGTPADSIFDFGAYRRRATADLAAVGDDRCISPVFGSAGMLAVRRNWRRRRDVLRAMFRVSAAVCQSSGATHIVVVVNHDTAAMYKRFRFSVLSEKFWSEEIGNFVTPLAATATGFHDWAFGTLPVTPLDDFKDSFERMVLRAGEVVFHEGEPGDTAYIVDVGSVRVSREGIGGRQLTLTHLSHGDLFGELALVDNEPRSATVTAVTDVELMTLDRAAFEGELRTNPSRSRELIKIFASRIREMDQLALVLAFAAPRERLNYAIKLARQRASEDARRPGEAVFKGGPQELAQLAAVEHSVAERYLEKLADNGTIRIGKRQIRFLEAQY